MAGESVLSRTYYDLATTTMENFLNSGKLYDIVFDHDAVARKFRDNVKVIQGGERLSGGVMDKKSQGTKSYSGTESLNVNISNVSTRWFLSNKLYAQPVGISGDDETSNRGPEAFINMLTERMENASLTLADRFSTDLCEDDGTGNSSKNITGLPAMVKTDPTTGTYANIDASVNTAWRNQIQTSIGSAATALLPKLRTLYNDCMQGSKREGMSAPDCGFTTQTIHEALEALLFPMFRFQQDRASSASGANMGVSDIYYKSMEVMWSPYITTTGLFYLINSRFSQLIVYAGRNFEMWSAGMLNPVNQDARIGQILLKGNLVCYARNKHGKGTGIT